MATCRIVIADDHPMILEYLRTLFAGVPDFEVVGEAVDGLALLQLAESLQSRLDVAVVDITMPKLHGIEATRRLKMSDPNVKVVILTVHSEREYLSEAVAAGADGYVLKDRAHAELLPAISAVRQGGRFVSRCFESFPDTAEHA